MAKYEVKTTFPVDEAVKGSTLTATKQIKIMSAVETPDVVDVYNSYLEAGYNVSVSFKAPEAEAEGEAEGEDDKALSPFDVGKALTTKGIDYKATLTCKAKGSYEEMKPIMHLIEAEGYDMTVNVQLKVNDKTTLNIDNTDSWTDEDAIFKVTPKAHSINVNDLKDLYDNLKKHKIETEIDIKPKKAKDDDDDITDSFSNQLSVYPDGTIVSFKLTEPKEK